MDYENLLDRAYAQIPAKKASGERFEIPVVDTLVQGNKTIIRNFEFITGKLRRDPKAILKYFTRELAIPATHEGSHLVLHGKFTDKVLNQCLRDFVDAFVLCKECGKPDTNIVEGEHGGRKMLVCEACGARAPVKG
jgi:translation initiation factor 2 subunit 2